MTATAQAMQNRILQLEGAKNKSQVKSLLMTWASSRSGVFHPIVSDIARTRSSTALDAIQVIGYSGHPDAEAELISIATSTDSKFTHSFVNACLRDMGTAAAIPYLRSMLGSLSQDVRCSALAALGHLPDPDMESISLGLLAGSKSDLRAYAHLLIAINGSPDCLCQMIESTKSLIKRRPKIQHRPDQLVESIYYFARFPQFGASTSSLINDALAVLDKQNASWSQLILHGQPLPRHIEAHFDGFKARSRWY
jgi:hypothetical protein